MGSISRRFAGTRPEAFSRRSDVGTPWTTRLIALSLTLPLVRRPCVDVDGFVSAAFLTCFITKALVPASFELLPLLTKGGGRDIGCAACANHKVNSDN
jgi:hypothetical protein